LLDSLLQEICIRKDDVEKCFRFQAREKSRHDELKSS